MVSHGRQTDVELGLRMRSASGQVTFVGLGQWTELVDERLTDGEHHVGDLQAAVDGLRAEVDTLNRAIAQVDDRLTELLARFDERHRPAGRSEQDMRHHDIAAAYQAFLDQELRSLVSTVARREPRLPAPAAARLAADLCRALFDGDAVDDRSAAALTARTGPGQGDLTTSRLAAAITRATAIRTEASRAGRAQRWGFDFVPDVPVDPRHQSVWPTADPDGSVAFVVAPSYLVDERTPLVPQTVFTAPAVPVATPDPAPARPATPEARYQAAAPGPAAVLAPAAPSLAAPSPAASARPQESTSPADADTGHDAHS